MVRRKIVRIDEDLCNGCGQCVPNCAEGALKIIEGKAKLVSEVYCDGLGACLGHCPQGAIMIEEREATAFNEEAVHEYLWGSESLERSCPSSVARSLESSPGTTNSQIKSELRHWPVQLRLVPVKAPFFEGADLMVTADCVPFAYPNMHTELIKGRSVVVGCPKFDDAKVYAEKLGEILKSNDIRSISVVHMEVPCCFGLAWVVNKALESSGKKIHVRHSIVTVKGEIREASN